MPLIDRPGRLLTAEDIADMLQVRRSWVYDAVRRGEIPHIRLGRYVRFRAESVEDWLAQREQRDRRLG